MRFEWDERKNMINIQKHGYSFKKAMKVFLDDNRIISDDYFENGEWRYNVIGMVDKVLLVACADRDQDVIRLISARPATKEEEAIYYDYDEYDS